MTTTNSGKTRVLITGASTGIGRAAAVHLAERGYFVFAAARGISRLEALEREVVQRGGALKAIALDVTSPESIARAREAIDGATEGYGVDVLINNAGYGQLGPMAEIAESDFRNQFETNVFGLVAMTQAFLPQMRARGAGRIINISSMGGRMTFPFYGAYHASKYAVEALSDALRMEVAPFGIRVVLVEPGVIATEFESNSVATLTKYRDGKSAYATLLETTEAKQLQMRPFAASVHRCSLAIAKAVSARRPCARYVVTAHARLLLFLRRWLPTPILDWMIRHAMGLTARGLRREG